MACSRVKLLMVRCRSLSQSQCDSVATLLGDPRSILSEINLFGPYPRSILSDAIHGRIDKEGLSTITVGLTRNTTLEKMCLADYKGDTSLIAQALCDTSSIDRIISSNHTLKEFSISITIPFLKQKVPPLIRDYLRLNTKVDKELVIRTKIARYYFHGEFNVLPFASMDMKLLPRVIAMIGGGETNRNAVSFKEDVIYGQSAIFRLLKCLPDLCNVQAEMQGIMMEMESEMTP